MPKHIEELVMEQMRRSAAAHGKIGESGKSCKCNVITISRTMGSGARIIAGKLVAEIGWSLWDKDLLEAIAEDAHISSKVAEAFDEHTSSDIALFIRSVLGEHEVGGFLYVKHLARAVAAVEKMGNAIILGRGASMLLPHALNVRIDASEEIRIRNMMQYENLIRGDAAHRIKESDRERRKFMLQTFGKEKVENARFDLSLEMDEFTNDDAVHIIRAALSRRCEFITSNVGLHGDQ